jgi:hypothetical protein
MLDFETKIKPLFVLIASEISVNLIRADQTNPKIDYPVLRYKVLSSPTESKQQNIHILKDAGPDNINKEINIKKSSIISLNILSDDYVQCGTKADDSLNWFFTQTAIDFFDNAEIVWNQVSKSIEDRTLMIENQYEYRFGYDIQLTGNLELENIIEAINFIEIKKTDESIIYIDLT